MSNLQPFAGRRPPPAPPFTGTGFSPNGDDSNWDEEAHRILLQRDMAALDLRLLQNRALHSQLQHLVRECFPDAKFPVGARPDLAILGLIEKMGSLSNRQLTDLSVIVRLRIEILGNWLTIEREFFSNPLVRQEVQEPIALDNAYLLALELFQQALAVIEYQLQTR